MAITVLADEIDMFPSQRCDMRKRLFRDSLTPVFSSSTAWDKETALAAYKRSKGRVSETPLTLLHTRARPIATYACTCLYSRCRQDDHPA